MCSQRDSRHGSVEMTISSNPRRWSASRDGSERVGVAHVTGDLVAGRLAEQGQRPPEALGCGLVTGHFGIDNAMQSLGRGRHHEVKEDLAFMRPAPDGLYERKVRGGSIGDE